MTALAPGPSVPTVTVQQALAVGCPAHDRAAGAPCWEVPRAVCGVRVQLLIERQSANRDAARQEAIDRAVRRTLPRSDGVGGPRHTGRSRR